MKNNYLKYFLTLTLSIFITFSINAHSSHAQELGDLNGDTMLTLDDAELSLNIVAGIDNPNSIGDVNQDGTNDLTDTYCILQAIADESGIPCSSTQTIDFIEDESNIDALDVDFLNIACSNPTVISDLNLSSSCNLLSLQTFVKGHQGTNPHWTLFNTPYIVTGNVSWNGTLTIDPGVEVLFNHFYALSGNIKAEGTDSQKILFSSNKPNPAIGDWNTINILNYNATLNHVILEYASIGVSGNHRGGLGVINYRNPSILNSTLTNNNIALRFDGLFDPIVINNVLINNNFGVDQWGDLNDVPLGFYKNNQFDNIISNFKQFIAGNVTAYFNWWGTTDPIAIRAKMTNSHNISFIPFLLNPSDKKPNYAIGQIITPTPNTTLPNNPVTFTWTPGEEVQSYRIQIGTTQGGSNIYDSAINKADTTHTVPFITNFGRTIYVRLSTQNFGEWFHNDYQYTESDGTIDLTTFTLTTNDESLVSTLTDQCFSYDSLSIQTKQTHLFNNIEIPSNFNHQFDFTFSTILFSDVVGKLAVWGVSDTPNKTYDNWNSGIYLTVHQGGFSGNGQAKAELVEVSNGTINSIDESIVIGTYPNYTIYATIEKLDQTVTAKLYSNISKTNLIDTLTLQVEPNTTFNTIYALSTPSFVRFTGNRMAGNVCRYKFGPPETPNLLGDLNDDGQITATDALIALNMAVGNTTPVDIDRADVTLDGMVTASDALCILRASTGAGSLPCSINPNMSYNLTKEGAGQFSVKAKTKTDIGKLLALASDNDIDVSQLGEIFYDESNSDKKDRIKFYPEDETHIAYVSGCDRFKRTTCDYILGAEKSINVETVTTQSLPYFNIDSISTSPSRIKVGKNLRLKTMVSNFGPEVTQDLTLHLNIYDSNNLIVHNSSSSRTIKRDDTRLSFDRWTVGSDSYRIEVCFDPSITNVHQACRSIQLYTDGVSGWIDDQALSIVTPFSKVDWEAGSEETVAWDWNGAETTFNARLVNVEDPNIEYPLFSAQSTGESQSVNFVVPNVSDGEYELEVCDDGTMDENLETTYVCDQTFDTLRLTGGLVASSGAGTNVSGTIDTPVWTKEGSPYYVTENIHAINSLTIMPGVQVIFNGPYEIWANFQVLGTEEEPILFTSGQSDPETNKWKLLRVTNESVFDHVIIEYAESGIFAQHMSPSITNSTFRFNQYGINIDGVSNLTITNCIITNNEIGIRHTGNLNNYPRGNYNYNAIYNNSNWNLDAFEIYGRVNARLNYWGSTNPNFIVNTIKNYHQVDISPFLNAPNGSPVENPKAQLISPADGSNISNGVTSSAVDFEWTSVPNADAYRLSISYNQGGENDIYDVNLGLATSTTISLPHTGAPLYVRLYSKLGILGWDYNDYVLQTNAITQETKATMISPPPGSTISTNSVEFQWDPGFNGNLFNLTVSRTQGARDDIYDEREGLNTSATVNNIPLTGEDIYVRIWTRFGVNWVYNDYVYKTTNTFIKANLVSPEPSTVLEDSSITFEWDAGQNVGEYWLTVSNEQGLRDDIYDQRQGLSQSATVHNIPIDGRTIYVRLWSFLINEWVYNDYTFQTQGNVLGDLNDDGQVTSTDALIALNMAVGNVAINLEQGDVNEDGVLTATDALCILRAATGSGTLPCNTTTSLRYNLKQTGPGTLEIRVKNRTLLADLIRLAYDNGMNITELGPIDFQPSDGGAKDSFRFQINDGHHIAYVSGCDRYKRGRCDYVLNDHKEVTVTTVSSFSTPTFNINYIDSNKVKVGKSLRLKANVENYGPYVDRDLIMHLTITPPSGQVFSSTASKTIRKDNKRISFDRWTVETGTSLIEVCFDASVSPVVQSCRTKLLHTDGTKGWIEDYDLTLNSQASARSTWQPGSTQEVNFSWDGPATTMNARLINVETDEQEFPLFTTGSTGLNQKINVTVPALPAGEYELEVCDHNDSTDPLAVELTCDESLGSITIPEADAPMTICNSEEAPDFYTCAQAYNNSDYYCPSQTYKNKVKDCAKTVAQAPVVTICFSYDDPAGYTCGKPYIDKSLDKNFCPTQNFQRKVKTCNLN